MFVLINHEKFIYFLQDYHCNIIWYLTVIWHLNRLNWNSKTKLNKMMKFNHLTGNETTTLIPLLWHQFVGSLHIFDFYFYKEIKIPPLLIHKN